MKKQNLQKPFLYIVICQLLILMLVAGNFLFHKLNLYEQVFQLTELNFTGDFIADDRLTIASTNSTAGDVVTTEPLKLSRGSYIIYLDYSTNTKGNTLSAVSDTMAASAFRSTPADLLTTQKIATLHLDIGSSTDDLTLNLYFQGQGSLEVFGLSIHETTDMAKQDMFHAFFLCLILALGGFIYAADLNKRQIIFSLSLITLFASLPLSLDYLIAGHDLPFQLLRIEGLTAGLRQGTFPVKIQPVWANDYGYATGVFYGDALLHIPAFFRLMGFSVQTAYQYFVFIVNTATVLISFYCFRKLFKSDRLGLLASMLYSLSLYRLINVYTRAAVGEYCAMIFLPMIFVGFYQIFTEYEEKKWWELILMPALGLTGIVQTHILTCEMVAIFILLTCIILIKKVVKPKIFLTLCAAAGLTILLNVGFLVPFIDYYFTEDFIINSDVWSTNSAQNHGLYPVQLFSVFQKIIGSSWTTAVGMPADFSPGIGLPLLIGFVFYLYYLLTAPAEEKKSKMGRLSLLVFLYAILTLYMCTYYFPWNAVEDLGSVFRAVVSSLQYPWRFLTLATLFITILTCRSIKKDSIVLLCILTLISSGWYFYSFTLTGDPYRVYETYEINSTQLYSCEYLPYGTVLEELKPNRVVYSEGIIVENYRKDGLEISCHVTNNGDKGYIEFPITAYKGYAATHVETGESLKVAKGFNNMIYLSIPAGFSGSLAIAFKEPIYWRIAEIISAISLIGLIAAYTIPCLKRLKMYRKAD